LATATPGICGDLLIESQRMLSLLHLSISPLQSGIGQAGCTCFLEKPCGREPVGLYGGFFSDTSA
jgi:hypothetical protein